MSTVSAAIGLLVLPESQPVLQTSVCCLLPDPNTGVLAMPEAWALPIGF